MQFLFRARLLKIKKETGVSFFYSIVISINQLAPLQLLKDDLVVGQTLVPEFVYL